MPKKRLVRFALALLAVPSGALAQIEPPSDYAERIEDRGEVGGVMTEADAESAQAETAEQSGGSVSGLSQRATRRVEEIVVQARRRDELLEETPLSVTAVSEQLLRENTTTRLADVAQLVPNLDFSLGRNVGNVGFSIRGIGNLEGGESGVGVYVDGVFMPGARGSVLNTVDIQQVEVLRGPQGTLFGKNTIAGAINVTTVKPSPDLEAFAFVRAGNLGLVETRAMINAPVSVGWFEDKLFTRFSIASANDQGNGFNTYRDERLGRRSGLWLLGSARLEPAPDVTIDLSGNWSRDSQNGNAGQCTYTGGGELDSLVLATFPTFPEDCAATGVRRNNANVAQIVDVQDYGIWGNVTWDVGEVGFLESLQLKAVGSWRQRSVRRRDDIDNTRNDLLRFSSLGGALAEGDPFDDQQFVAEGQVNGAALDGSLVFVTGVFAFWQKGDNATTTTALDGLSNSYAPIHSDNWDWAIFGQSTWDPIELLSLTAGLRYTEEKRGLERSAFDLTVDPPERTGGGRGSAIYTSWTPMASLAVPAPDDWLGDAPIDTLMGYLTYSHGFTSGGFNAALAGTSEGDAPLRPFEPATLDNFEIGFKTVGWDQRITFNASFFLGTYKDQQVVTLLVEPPTTPDGIPSIQRVVDNAAESTLKGFELEAFTRPIEGLEVNGNIGVTDARYDMFDSTRDDVPGDVPIDRSGQRFGLPELTSFVSAQYSFPVNPGSGWLEGWVTPRVEWAYTSDYFLGAPELPNSKAAGYNIINARLSYDFWDDRAQVALWGKNLIDKTVAGTREYATSLFGFDISYYRAPRTFGAELSVRLD